MEPANPLEDDDWADASPDPMSSVGKWFVVLTLSIGIFLLTTSPLLATIWPYTRAGWPSIRSAWWLRRVDPWRTRGQVGFYFHLAMAGFRAGIAGVLMVILLAVLADVRQKNPDMNQFITAMCVILTGIGVSFVFGWWGAILAFRHRVRVFVISNLVDVCHGDFSHTKRLSTTKYQVNPANYVLAVAIATPTLALWFAAMVALVPMNAQPDAPTEPALLLLWALPVLAIGCIALLIFLSTRIIAKTPQECWLAVPTTNDHEINWYGDAE